MSKLQVFRCEGILSDGHPLYNNGGDIYILGSSIGNSVTNCVVLGNIKSSGEIILNGFNINSKHLGKTVQMIKHSQIPISLKYKSGKVDRNNKFMISIPELSLIYIHSPKLNNESVIEINTKKGSIKRIEFDLFERIKDGNIIKKNVEIISNRKVKKRKVMSGTRNPW